FDKIKLSKLPSLGVKPATRHYNFTIAMKCCDKAFPSPVTPNLTLHQVRGRLKGPRFSRMRLHSKVIWLTCQRFFISQEYIAINFPIDFRAVLGQQFLTLPVGKPKIAGGKSARNIS
ncbi:MAG: hypothetical protein FWB74_02875, partial [Defluviitaleaceae bacterium]|nr:hypothetical protein [Defluviitaleaceae bacterium]